MTHAGFPGAAAIARANLTPVIVQEGGYLRAALPANAAAFPGAFDEARGA